MTVKPKTMEVWDWIEVQDEVEKRTGRDIRDWAGKYKGPEGPAGKDVPYQDFWYWVIDRSGDNIHNGCLEPFNFEEMIEDSLENQEEAWIVEVLQAFLDVVGPGEHLFHIWW